MTFNYTNFNSILERTEKKSLVGKQNAKTNSKVSPQITLNSIHSLKKNEHTRNKKQGKVKSIYSPREYVSPANPPCTKTQQLIQIALQRQPLIKELKKYVKQINQAKKLEKTISLKEFEKQIKQMQNARS